MSGRVKSLGRYSRLLLIWSLLSSKLLSPRFDRNANQVGMEEGSWSIVESVEDADESNMISVLYREYLLMKSWLKPNFCNSSEKDRCSPTKMSPFNARISSTVLAVGPSDKST